MAKVHQGKFVIALVMGVFVGVGLFTFHFADGFSYFKTNPEACANCHIMQPQLNSWRKSSHHTVAVCVDCHLPQSFLPKYLAKADNGYRHSKGFTFQDFPEPIQIGQRNSKILQENCLRCHLPMVENLSLMTHCFSDGVSCVHCHHGVGHGEYVGLGKIYEPVKKEEL